MINHCERFLSGKAYSLDEEGIENMLSRVEKEKGKEVSLQARNHLTKTVDKNASIDDLIIYIVTCTLPIEKTVEEKEENDFRKCYQVSHDGGQDCKIILAKTRYEAAGFYLLEEAVDITATSLDRIEILSPDFKVEIPSAEASTFQTLEQLFQEQDVWTFPHVLISFPTTINKAIE